MKEWLPCTGSRVLTFRSFLSWITSSWPVSCREHTQHLYHPCYLLLLTCRGCGCCGLPENVGRICSSCLRAQFTAKLTVPEQFHTTALDLIHACMGVIKHRAETCTGALLCARQYPFRNNELKTLLYYPVKEWKHIGDLLSVLVNVGCKSQCGDQLKPLVTHSHLNQREIKLKCSFIQNFFLWLTGYHHSAH